MKIFFVWSESYKYALLQNKVPVIFSWTNSKSGMSGGVVPDECGELMIDSGGYQLQSGADVRKTITPEHYALWLNLTLPRHPEIVAYMNLDILGDVKQTLENQHYLETEGLYPLPIWHIGDEDKVLDSYCEKYQWVALGGFVSKNMGKPGIRITINRIKQRHPYTKFHFLGIGISGTSVFRSFRPYSTDCSTWTAPVRYGTEIQYDKDGLLRERKASEEKSRKIVEDKEYRKQVLIETVRRIKEFGDKIEDLEDPFQANLL